MTTNGALPMSAMPEKIDGLAPSIPVVVDSPQDFHLLDGFDSPHPAEVDSHELHVLAVDDSLVDRKVIERLLKISSCKVTAVDSGTRALQYLGLDGEQNSVGFNGLKVNLIITDYWMPGMTGYELLKKIKESSTFREIPVVIMSSENVLPRINRCLEEGAEEFIVKPVKLSDVKRLKDYIMREEVEENRVSRGNLKRKLEDSEDEDLLLSTTTTSSSSSSSSSTVTSSPPSSPLNSPSRRHRTSPEISTDQSMLQ